MNVEVKANFISRQFGRLKEEEALVAAAVVATSVSLVSERVITYATRLDDFPALLSTLAEQDLLKIGLYSVVGRLTIIALTLKSGYLTYNALKPKELPRG